MTYSLIIGGETERPLASTAGWGEFRDWTDQLDNQVYPQLVHLVDHSFSQELKTLEVELDRAIKQQPPQGPVLKTATDLLQSIRERGDVESVFVSDGTSEEEVEEDWQSESEL